MCFSAPASFAASAVLGVIGILTLGKVSARNQILFASIPILFALQQFTEGVLWLILLGKISAIGAYWPTLIYNGFVGVIWPMLIPLSIYLLEPSHSRKHCIAIIFMVGIMVASYSIYIVLQFGISAEIANKCILYDTEATVTKGMLMVYILATCLPFFFSTDRRLIMLGIANIVAFIAAYYFYHINYASVWCFFAAIISGLIYSYFKKLNHPNQLNAQNPG